MPTYVAELDDGSLSFHYGGPWSFVKGTSSEFLSTVHSTNQVGASAAVRFIGKVYIFFNSKNMSHQIVIQQPERLFMLQFQQAKGLVCEPL